MTGDTEDMLQRLKLVLPAGWFADVTPVLDALLTGLAGAWRFLFTLLANLRLQTRIATASGIFLDIAASDFLGADLPRLSGETDRAYSARIRATLLAPLGTSWLSAAVTGGSWVASLTPATAGIFYIWAELIGETNVHAVSAAIQIVAASLTVGTAASGTAGSALAIAGTVSPILDAVNVQLALQNTASPATGWSAATNSGGNFTASLTPAAAGSYYVWAQDPITGLTAVSAAIAVAAAPAISFGFNDPGGSYVHGSAGTIGLNGAISPAQDIPVQVALATSSTAAPSTGWQAASIVYGNTLWAVFMPTPATAGNYYIWVETVAGASQTVSSFTLSVT